MSHFCHNLDNETGMYKNIIFINEWKKMKIKIHKYTKCAERKKVATNNRKSPNS